MMWAVSSTPARSEKHFESPAELGGNLIAWPTKETGKNESHRFVLHSTRTYAIALKSWRSEPFAAFACPSATLFALGQERDFAARPRGRLY